VDQAGIGIREFSHGTVDVPDRVPPFFIGEKTKEEKINGSFDREQVLITSTFCSALCG
jgi:hypothetical protein